MTTRRTIAIEVRGVRYSRFGFSRCETCPRIRVLFYCNGHALCAICIEAEIEPVPTLERKGGDQTD